MDIHTIQHKRIIVLAAMALTFGYFVIWYLFEAISNKGSLLRFHDAPIESYLLSCAVLMMCSVIILLFKALEDHRRIIYAERYDHDTGLPNATFLRLHLGHLAGKGQLERTGALFAVGIDGLVSINVSHGYGVGDAVIREVSERLLERLGRNCLIVRMSGDTFGVFMHHIRTRKELSDFAQTLTEIAKTPIAAGGATTFVSFSIGAVLAIDAESKVDNMIRRAELCLLQARTERDTSLVIYTSAIAKSSQRLGSLETGLREALESGEIDVFYQPLINGDKGSMGGVEALARWTHPQIGAVSPAEFVPLAESLGLNEKLGSVVLRKACSDIKPISGLTLAVNISPNHLLHPDFIQDIDHILDVVGFDPSLLEIEITESVFMKLPSRVRSVMEDLQSRGISVALDDFGTGYSGLAHLRDYKFDRIKVDASFTSGLGKSREAEMLFQSIIDLVELTGARITVEGIEKKEQLDYLKRFSGFWHQGYLLSRPMSYVELLRSDALRGVGLDIAMHGGKKGGLVSVVS